MLDVLRARKGGILSWIFLGAIIASFVIYFGPGKFEMGGAGCGAAPMTTAAYVDGKAVPAVLFQMALDNEAEVARFQYGDRFAEALPILGQQIMDQLVSQAVLAREAERRGIRIPDEELFEAQRKRPEFQQDGRFSRDFFQQYVTRRFGSVDTYLNISADGMAAERLQGLFGASVHVPESEVKEAWKERTDQVDLVYVAFPIAEARAEVKLGDAEIQAFAAKESARLQKFYEENAARYDQPKKVRARHILARIEGTDGDAAKKEIEAAIERLQKGEDFAKVAAELSDDESTKANGGDLGVISAGQVDAAFSKAALELEAGKLSAPVQTPSGWHVIKVDEVIPAKKIPLADVRDDIARELLVADRAAALVKGKAEAALAAAKSGKSLTELYPQPKPAVEAAENRPAMPEVKAALTLNGKPVAAVETNAFPASAPEVYGLPGSAALMKDAVAAEAKTVLPRVYETQTGPVVAVVKNRQRPDEKLYPVQRRAVEIALAGEKERQLAYTWRTELEKNADVDKNEQLVTRLTTVSTAPPVEE
ncbi:MAG TPA: SurA N-terminal domain-containing protein [Anaeromyxobacter sp.]|nr:SurA N-terminal domain-containing protein [Anaeromyxobacter sp.]